MLKIENIDVRYGPIEAVKSISLTVEESQIVTVVGANGAGKSSLLRAIAGMEQISGGSMSFEGQSLAGMSAPARVKAGMTLVPEGRQIFVSMTVEENLLMGAYTQNQQALKSGVDAIFDRFPNLASRRNSLASVLSGGEQQMLAIGRAMIARPKLMMLDEPSLGLSPMLVNQLFELIVELNKEGISILLVEQNVKMALETAERGYVLELGSVRQEGSAAELAADKTLAEAYLG
ncbi:ABC transporter ATP-binding protein [Alphaproteobacteria bacterium]|jgi:branched-chain amino acid transport system ATP-binding protein|nr:ABC transporter ATP-binding protein [Alphaproteobacteria bacterium]